MLKVIGIILVAGSFIVILCFPPIPTRWASEGYKAYAERFYAKHGLNKKTLTKRALALITVMLVGIVLLFV